MVEALTDGGLRSQLSEPLDALGIRRFRDATLARTCSACTSVSGGSAIGSAVGRMPASMIATHIEYQTLLKDLVLESEFLG